MADEHMMRFWLSKHGRNGLFNVIIFKDGTPADVGPHDSEQHETAQGKLYNVYVGARGTWRNKGDGGWVNWGMTGTYDKQDKVVHFH